MSYVKQMALYYGIVSLIYISTTRDIKCFYIADKVK